MVSRQELLPGLAILRDFEQYQLRALAAANRAAFVQACADQGHYVPSDVELDRWFSV